MPLGPGPQFHPPTLKFWNLLGSTAQVQQSAAGPNCTELGSPTYEPGFFGNAVRIDANAEAIQAFNVGQIFNMGEGCVEMWTFNDGYTITNGAPSDAVQHTMWSSFRVSGGTQFMYIGYVVGGFWFVIARNGAFTGWGGGIRTPAIMDAGNQEWHHVACSWSMTGAMSGDTMRIYFDNVLADSTALAIVGMPVLTDGETHYVGLNRNGNQHPFIGRLDNVKVWDFPKTDFTDSMTEEGFTPAPTPDVPTPNLFSQRSPRILVMGQDITCKVASTPAIKEERKIGSDLVFPADCLIKVENFDGSFSLEGPNSLFSGTNWQNERVRVFDRETIEIWDGVLASVLVDDARRTSTLVSRSRLHEWRDFPVTYTGTGEAPAEVLINIAAAIGFTFLDLAAATASQAQQEAAGLLIDTTLADTDEPKATFAQVLNALATFGAADVYHHIGLLRYVFYTGAPARPAVSLTACDLVTVPKKIRKTNPLINDYSIGHSGGGPETDATGNNIGAASRSRNGTFPLKEVPAVVDAKYAVQDATAAIAIGDAYIGQTHIEISGRARPRIEIQFDVELHHRTWITLETDFSLTYEPEGWVDKAFRITAFTRDDEKRKINLVAKEWPR